MKLELLNTTQTELNLNNNNIGPKKTIAIADFLRNNTNLKKIDLSENNIGQ